MSPSTSAKQEYQAAGEALHTSLADVALIDAEACATDLPPSGVPTELRKSWVARLIDLRDG